MAKNDRFFEIIQLLRGAKRPLLARDMAATLEVSVRTIYRDIATLQARQTPIYGEAGVGYVMRRGYDLPPLNFDADEAEAISVGLSMIARTGDRGLWKSARSAARKLNEAAPGARRLIASSWGAQQPPYVDIALVRSAIREEQKLLIGYQDARNASTERTVWPFALIYYADKAMLAAWCEIRQSVRHFRLDRVLSCAALTDRFSGQGRRLLDAWEQTQKDATVNTKTL